MKYLFIFVICLFSVFLWSQVTLNEYGHISGNQDVLDAEYSYRENEYFIFIDGFELIGNSVYCLPNGYLTMVNEAETIPTWLRIYNKNGKEIYNHKFQKIINLQLSPNKMYAVFSTAKSTSILNLMNFQITEFPKSIVFAVDDFGNPVYCTENSVTYKNWNFNLDNIPRQILFLKNEPLIFTSRKMYKMNNELLLLHSFSGKFFEAKIIDEKLYFVDRIKRNSEYSFQLFSSSDLRNFQPVASCNFNLAENRTHDPIYCPLQYGIPENTFPVGNSYGEHQYYGGSPYAHPGMDFMGDDYQEVYAVHDGVVKAILTTSASAHWRIAIANEDISTECEGYLYAHLNHDSMVHTIGDSVQAGDYLGTLYDWMVADFTHLHFARIRDEGATWNGSWWTTDNPHIDVINLQDSIPPVFENALDDGKFAFRTAGGSYLNSFNLEGQFDIIAKCYDICNCDWQIDVYDMWFSLHPIENPDSTVYELFSYKFDMLLDGYFGSYYTNMAINTIYSQDAVCYSLGNYDTRQYYHIITNSDGDSLLTENDEPQLFDSTQFSDGLYWLKVTARDASWNAASDSMLISFNNGISVGNDLPDNEINLSNYPNPFNPSTTISFNVTQTPLLATIEIYNLKGQKVKTFSNLPITQSSNQQITWNGTDNNNKPVSSGIYFYKLKTKTFEKTNKMILIK